MVAIFRTEENPGTIAWCSFSVYFQAEGDEVVQDPRPHPGQEPPLGREPPPPGTPGPQICDSIMVSRDRLQGALGLYTLTKRPCLGSLNKSYFSILYRPTQTGGTFWCPLLESVLPFETFSSQQPTFAMKDHVQKSSFDQHRILSHRSMFNIAKSNTTSAWLRFGNRPICMSYRFNLWTTYGMKGNPNIENSNMFFCFRSRFTITHKRVDKKREAREPGLWGRTVTVIFSFAHAWMQFFFFFWKIVFFFFNFFIVLRGQIKEMFQFSSEVAPGLTPVKILRKFQMVSKRHALPEHAERTHALRGWLICPNWDSQGDLPYLNANLLVFNLNTFHFEIDSYNKRPRSS